MKLAEKTQLADQDTTAKPGLGAGRNGLRPRKPRTLKQHLIRRLLVVIPASLLMIVVMKTGWLDMAADRLTFNKLAWFDNTKLVEHLRVLVRHNGMTDEPARCLVFLVNGDDPPTAMRVDVMAKHTEGCPHPDKKPQQLFTVRVDKVDRMLTTDAGSPGVFHPMGS